MDYVSHSAYPDSTDYHWSSGSADGFQVIPAAPAGIFWHSPLPALERAVPFFSGQARVLTHLADHRLPLETIASLLQVSNVVVTVLTCVPSSKKTTTQ